MNTGEAIDFYGKPYRFPILEELAHKTGKTKMAVITADDIKTSINTLQDAIVELAHEVASMQNQVSELQIKKDSMDETLLEMERINQAICERWRRADPYPYTPLKNTDVMEEAYNVMKPTSYSWNPEIEVDGDMIYLGYCENQWDSICLYMSARNRLLGGW